MQTQIAPNSETDFPFKAGDIVGVIYTHEDEINGRPNNVRYAVRGEILQVNQRGYVVKINHPVSPEHGPILTVTIRHDDERNKVLASFEEAESTLAAARVAAKELATA